jgi:type IV fimbrial biogenesis protein FimT
MKKPNGFTLVELMVVIAIAGILAMIAAPSFSRMIESTALSSDVNTFLADARFARNEAVRRGTVVVMCSSTNPEATTPTCSESTVWNTGWIMFEDKDNDGSHASDEPLLRQQSPLNSSGSITSVAKFKFLFVATGRIRTTQGADTLTFSRSAANDNTRKRVVCIDASGRARIAGDGSKTC